MPAYLDAMMHDYHMPFPRVMREFPLVAGMALMDARHERLSPGGGASYVDRVAEAAMVEERARLKREFVIIDSINNTLEVDYGGRRQA